MKNKEYKDTIEYLFNQLPVYQNQGKKAYKANLDTTIALDEYFDHPHTSYKTIHVAGTNGKGSVSHMIASVLQEQGYKVGLYTSPHLLDFRERIRVNGIMTSEQYVVDFVRFHKKIINRLKPSFFEITVAMAFDYFKKENVDWAVVEVGLGGRLDSTNVITPELSVITNISIDHADLLGDTLSKIAAEKAGIIKENIPVVIGERQDEVHSVFTGIAKKRNSDILFADDIVDVETGDVTWLITETEKICCIPALQGMCQDKNIKTVVATIDVLRKKGYSIDVESLKTGLEKVVVNTSLQGRWETLGEEPKIICDTAHNEGGVYWIARHLKRENYRKLHIVWGMVNDKDVNNIIKLLPKDAFIYASRPEIARGLDEIILKNNFVELGYNVEEFKNVNKALNKAKKNSGANDLIFIGGSTFVVADALRIFKKNI